MADQTGSEFGVGNLAPEHLEQRLRYVGHTAEDRERVIAVRADIVDHVDEHVGAFFDRLAKFEEARALLGRLDLLAEAKQLKREHLIAMVQGDYTSRYVEQRFRLGQLYNRSQVEVGLLMGAYHALLASIGARILKRFPKNAPAAIAHFESVKQVAFFDLAIIVDAMIADREQTILRQQEAIR
jgi:rsbT co-antagonist protein RsbR